MTAKETAAALGCSRTQLQRLIAAGKIRPTNPPVNPNVQTRPRHLMFHPADVQAVLSAPPPPPKLRKPRARKAPQPAPPA